MRTLFAIHLNLLSTGLFLFIANIAGPVHAEYRSHDSHPPHFLASSLSSKANLGASKTLNRHVAAALESLMKGENHPRDEQVRNCQYVINHGPGWYCDKRLKLHSVFWEISHIIYKLPPETRGLFVEGCQSEAKLLLNKGLSEHRYDLIDDAIHRCPSSEPSHMAFVLMIQNLLDRKQPHLAALYARGLMAQPIEHNPQEIHLCARALASAGYKDEAIELWNKLPAKLNIAGESATKQRALELLHELLRAKHGPPVESIRTLAGAQNNEIFRRAIRLLSPKELATVLGVEDLEKTQSFSYCPLPVLVDSDVNYLTEDLFHQEFKPSAEQLMKAIVPASLIAKLGKALQSTEPHWLPSAAADALAKVGVPAIPTLIRALHTEETVPVTSLFAARALTKIGTPAVPALIHVLETGHQSAKRQAHAALFKIEGGSAILLLTAALKNPNVRWEAIDVLRATGKRAAPAVNELINVLETDDNVTIRTAAASALGSIEKGAVAAVNALAKMLLREEDGVARRTAAFALGKIQTSSALLALVKALEDRDMSVRLDVIVAIAEFGQKAALAVPMLTKVLNDENVRIRLAALSAIGKIGYTTPAITAVENLLRHEKDYLVRFAALSNLAKLGKTAVSAVPILIETLNDDNANLRTLAASVLGNFGKAAAPAVPTMIKILESNTDNATREGMIQALGKIGDPSVLAPLIKILEGERSRIQPAACRALGDLGKDAAPAVPALTKILEDNQNAARSEAAYALGRTGIREASPALIKALADTDWDVRMLASYSLAELDAHWATPALTKALEDQHSYCRAAAALALLKFGKNTERAASVFSDFLDQTEYPTARQSLLEAVGKLGKNAAALAPKISAISKADPNESVRNAASTALKQITGLAQGSADPSKGERP